MPKLPVGFVAELQARSGVERFGRDDCAADAAMQTVYKWVNRSSASRQAEIEHRRSRRIPRPLNAFMLYKRAYWGQIKALYEKQVNELHGRVVLSHELSVVTGIHWHKELPIVRECFKQLAQVEEERHGIAFPTYCFHPSPKNTCEQQQDSANTTGWSSKKRRRITRAALKESKMANIGDMAGVEDSEQNRSPSQASPELPICSEPVTGHTTASGVPTTVPARSIPPPPQEGHVAVGRPFEHYQDFYGEVGDAQIRKWLSQIQDIWLEQVSATSAHPWLIGHDDSDQAIADKQLSDASFDDLYHTYINDDL